MSIAKKLLMDAGGIGILSAAHPDLMLYYDMTNSSGTDLIDESINSRDSTLVNGASLVAGELDFNPGEKYTVTQADLPTINEFAVAFWLTEPNNSTTTIITEISTNSNIVTGGWFFGGSVIDAGDFAFNFRKIGGSDSLIVKTSGSFNDGTSQYFILFQYDRFGATVADQVKLFIDDVEHTTIIGTNTTSIATSIRKMYMGLRFNQDPFGSLEFDTDGQMGPCRMFEKILTASERTELFNGGTPA